MKKLQSLLALLAAIASSICTVNAATEGKSYQGIYCLGSLQTGATVMYNTTAYAPIWKADYLSGVALQATWASIEPSAGGYDFSMSDDAVAIAEANNKKISLVVEAGTGSPTWLINEGASSINLATSSDATQRASIVVPWDPIFQKEWSALVSAEGARYDTDANVGYVMVSGIGIGTTSSFIRNQADYNTFAAAGGLSKWVQGSEAIIDMYGAAFQNTPFLLALANPVTLVPSENAAGQHALQQVINYGMAKYPGRFGIASHSLNSTSLTKDADSFINQDIEHVSSTAPTGFQMETDTTSTNPAYSVGNLGVASQDGMQMGAQFLEVYLVDCQNPSYTAMLKAANQLLNGN